MGFRIKVLAVLTLIFVQNLIIPTAQATTPVTFQTFTQGSAGIVFDGVDTSILRVTANSAYEVGESDFTIDWWQKAPKLQSKFPRLFQFGDFKANGDGFAVSQEDGGLFFWLDSRTTRSGVSSKVNLTLPDSPEVWKHYAVVRYGLSISLYLDGVAISSYNESPVDVSDLEAPRSTLGTPSGLGALDLLIGGSNDSEFGGFLGEITGFEFIKGARWTTDFTPPTVYTDESCLHLDENNICDQERVLLIYPTSDFDTAGEMLVNRIDGTEIPHAPGVIYGISTPTPSYTNVTLLNSDFGGRLCAYDFDDVERCTGSASQELQIEKDWFGYIEFILDGGCEIASVTLTLSDEPETIIDLTSISLRSSHEITVELNETSYIFEWNGDALKIPANFVDFEIEVIFQLISTDVTLLPSENGQICAVNFGITPVPCSGSTSTVLSFDPDILRAREFRIENDEMFNFEAVTIKIGDGPSYTDSTKRDSFTVLDVNDEPWVFEWLQAIRRLKLPIGVPDFEISISLVAEPPAIKGPSLISGEVNFGSLEPFHINSIDSSISNDYGSIDYMVLEIPYFGQDPDNPLITNKKLFCRALVEDWVVTDLTDDSEMVSDANIDVRLPSLQSFTPACPGYAQTNEKTVGKLYLFDYIENFNFLTVSTESKEHDVDIEINTPPAENSPPVENTPPVQPHRYTFVPEIEITIEAPAEIVIAPTVPVPTPEIITKPVFDSSWCTKKGIWIYTISGKLRVCDPSQQIAVQMKACSGKASTPTYPWIFKPQRFISGSTPSKSGKVLINAVFFFKGLAISGSEKVSDKPCSNGSVFIPVEYSKMVYNFAKTQQPIIWVKAS
jgi:Concanavalin A-like lectin/glucanases superfamily